jgi:hypothetical protein
LILQLEIPLPLIPRSSPVPAVKVLLPELVCAFWSTVDTPRWNALPPLQKGIGLIFGFFAFCLGSSAMAKIGALEEEVEALTEEIKNLRK